MISPTQQRDEASRLASTDASRALAIAREINDPWFRCQALAAAAVFLSPPLKLEVIDEAFESANELEEPNRAVTVSSWPLKALALSGDRSRVQSEGARLLATISEEPSPVRRADALRALLGATAAASAPIAAEIAESFGAACLQPLRDGRRNKKGEYLLEEAIPVIARINSDLASSLNASLPATRAERASKAIEAASGKRIEEFFPVPNLRGPAA